MEKRNILVIGSYGRGNAGDDAFLVAILKLFHDYNIIINCADKELLPDEVKNKVTTINTHGYSDVLKKIKIFLGIKFIVYGGGDLWVELHGEKFPRVSLYKMLVVNLFSRAFGKKIFYFGCGAGPISGFSLFLARISARLATYIIARDSRTLDLLGMNSTILLPDLAINLFENNRVRRKGKRGECFYVGVSMLYFVPNPRKNFPVVKSELKKLFHYFKEDNVKFIIVPFFKSEEIRFDDYWVAKDIVRGEEYKNVEIFESNRLEDILDLLSGIDLMVGARLHANILSVLSGTPAIGISYRPKVKNFFIESGLERYCIEINETQKLISIIENILTDTSRANQDFDNARSRIIEKKKDYENIVRQYFA